jgi:aspartate/methionine/tyrosine aminotransferase
MLEEAGVATTTASTMIASGHRTMRLSFAGSHKDIREAVARLGNWLR